MNGYTFLNLHCNANYLLKNETSIIFIEQYRGAFFKSRFRRLHSLKSGKEDFVEYGVSLINFQKNHGYTNSENYIANHTKLISKFL
jgi:hypothetical protein